MSRGIRHHGDRLMLRIARSALIAREHRELGMRPPFWAGLAEVFVDAARRARNRTTAGTCSSNGRRGVVGPCTLHRAHLGLHRDPFGRHY